MASAILCDPPYHLTSGFMGAVWDQETDGTGIAFRPDTWSALAKHLLPGGFIMAFASSRGWHRLACALEDAGLIIQPSIFNWHSGQTMEISMYGWASGQSFPKATSIDKQLDRAANVTNHRKKVGKYELPEQQTWNPKQATDANAEAVGGTFTASGRRTLDIEEPATELGRTWAGHRYGGQVLKNLLEPIIIAQKPYEDVPSDAWATFTGWHWWHYPKKIKNTPKERLKLWKKHGIRIPAAYVEYDAWFIKRRALHEGIESDVLLVWRDRRQDRLRLTRERILHRGNVKKYRRWKIKNKSACIAMTGAGAFWIDGGRLGTFQANTPSGIDRYNKALAEHGYRPGEYQKGKPPLPTARGRWPASLVLSHVPPDSDGNGGCVRLGTKRVKGIPNRPTNRTTDKFGKNVYQPTHCRSDNEMSGGCAGPDGREVVDDWQCVEGCPVRKIGLQSGERKSGYMKAGQQRQASQGLGGYHDGFPDEASAGGTYGDKGTCSRFFFQASWHYEVAERLAQASPVGYCAKAGRREKSAGLGGGDGVRNLHPT